MALKTYFRHHPPNTRESKTWTEFLYEIEYILGEYPHYSSETLWRGRMVYVPN